MKFTVEDWLSKLPLPADGKWKEGVWDVEAFKKENVSLIFFAPQGTDYQTFHEQDEFYFVMRGTAELIVETEKFDCAVGDAFFVPARAEHHFEKMSDDFATWAIFF